jgi:hypothetical protein
VRERFSGVTDISYRLCGNRYVSASRGRRIAMSDFIFRVTSAKLTPAQEQKIASAIQGAVITELAQLDLGAPSSPSCLFVPIKWAGGIMIAPGDVQTVTGQTFTITAKTAT